MPTIIADGSKCTSSTDRDMVKSELESLYHNVNGSVTTDTHYIVEVELPVMLTQTDRPWCVGDKCWVCNDAGHGISDDSYDAIGDDLTMTILALYDSPNHKRMAVVAQDGIGAHLCFRIDMLRKHVSKRDKVIDRAIKTSKTKKCEFVPSVHREVIGKLYDAGLLKDDDWLVQTKRDEYYRAYQAALEMEEMTEAERLFV